MTDKKSPLTVTVTISVTGNTYVWLKAESERLGVPMSTVARWALEAHVEKKQKREFRRTVKELNRAIPPTMESTVEL